eukprot:CAMPEP_0116023852 /NCGR_PEP_ID=MMETSP0321-20121206/11904_1 /TAXON_ID=163516 /ORGANISM="Leptocylindrus danicus var. danicus, Strain B650" /LENGTH=430 /DNA_ID=CAMNT_0003495343 /DNA_START=652 /DNA_END=1944 /DNA_ORIENTATION=+
MEPTPTERANKSNDEIESPEVNRNTTNHGKHKRPQQQQQQQRVNQINVDEKESGPVLHSATAVMRHQTVEHPFVRPVSRPEPKTKEEIDIGLNGWKVPEQLKNVPPHYPLAPGHCTIFVPHTASELVASRILKCLRDQSIYSVFDAEEARVHCTTLGLVEFIVSLFAGRGDYSHGVIVEVRRRTGCSLAFFRARCAVTLSAEGKPVTEEAVTACSQKLQLLDMQMSEEEDAEICNEALDDITILMDKERQDGQLLGGESLANLTDGIKSGSYVAKLASVTLLKDQCKNEQFVKYVTEFLGKPHTLESDCDAHHFRIMRHWILIVLANVVSSAGEEDLGLVHGDNQAVFEQLSQCVMLLVAELKTAKERPHGAYNAARALSSLIKTWPSVEVRSKIFNDDLEIANYIGIRCHARLERESNDIMKSLYSEGQ